MDIRTWAKYYQGPKFHAILTDPPYNLESINKRFGKPGSKAAKHGKDGAFTRVSTGFMGKAWDTDVAFDPDVWYAIGEHLYPGAFGLAYMGARTYHKAATAIEEAGFIIHPMIGWIQSQGFPKATRIDTQIDRRKGQLKEREVLGPIEHPGSTNDRVSMHDGWQENPMRTKPATALAQVWEDYRYGLQSLKPCLEPIIMFQRPYENKPVDDIMKTGAGALNIEGTKFDVGREIITNRFTEGMKPFGNAQGEGYDSSTSNLLYPANVILSGEVGEPFENFFYNAKVMPKEREAGLRGHLPCIKCGETDTETHINPKTGREEKCRRCDHPTLKPIILNTYLATLLLPPDIYKPRRLLVPFSGTGSEVIGGALAGWDNVIGVELEPNSVVMSQVRVNYWINEK